MNLDPAWMRVDWLSKFEVLEWERLEETRKTHRELLHEYRSAEQEVQALRSEYAREDKKADDMALVAARVGTEAPHTDLTPERTRQARLQVALEKSADALTALCEHVDRTVGQILTYAAEAEDALERGFGAFGLPPVRPGGSVPVVEPSASDVDAIADVNREAQEVNRQITEATTSPEFKKWVRDKELLSSLVVGLQTGGQENIRSETQALRAAGAASS